MLCKKCMGVSKLVFGVLLLLNAFVWPLWTGIDGWFAWIGMLLVLAGVAKLALPVCPGCAACDTKAAPEKSRKRK